MNVGKFSAAAVAALAIGFAGSQLSADTIQPVRVGPDDPGIIVTFDDEGLKATITAELLERKMNNVWRFAISIVNESPVATQPQSRITAFAFGLETPATAVSIDDNDGGLWNWSQTSASRIEGAGFQNLDPRVNLCAGTGKRTCVGGGNAGAGVTRDNPSTMVLEITSDVDSLLFVSAGTRWQSTGLDGEGSTVIGADSIAPIPLPPVGFMLLGALGALAFAARRRQVEKV